MSLGCLSHEGTEGSASFTPAPPGPEEGPTTELCCFSLWNDRGVPGRKQGRPGKDRAPCGKLGPGQVACPAWSSVCSSVKRERPSLPDCNLTGLVQDRRGCQLGRNPCPPLCSKITQTSCRVPVCAGHNTGGLMRITPLSRRIPGMSLCHPQAAEGKAAGWRPLEASWSWAGLGFEHSSSSCKGGGCPSTPGWFWPHSPGAH